jgi:hypothetical protein
MKIYLFNIILVCLGSLLISGCSHHNTRTVVYDSKPLPGLVVCNGFFENQTPIHISHYYNAEEQQKGEVALSKCKIQWTHHSTTLTKEYPHYVNFNKFLNGVTFTVKSPRKYTVTFDSYPQGATVICNNKNLGYTPQTSHFLLNTNEDTNVTSIESCSANWASGYSQNYPSSISTKKSDTEEDVNFLLRISKTDGYNMDSHGYNIDTEFELKVQTMQYQKKAAEDNVRANKRAASAAEANARAAAANARANEKAASDAYYQNLKTNMDIPILNQTTTEPS